MHQRIDYRALVLRLIAQGQTTAAIGKAIGLSQPSVSRLASGKTAAIGADAAIRLIQLGGGQVTLPADVTAEVAH